MFIYNGLSLSHEIFSILLTTSFLFVPYQYAIICVILILYIMLGWKYNKGRCFVRTYELHSKDPKLEELPLNMENNLYQSFKKMGYDIEYENFDLIIHIILLCCCFILIYRYVYKINFIPFSDLTENIYIFIFIMSCISLLLFIFTSMYSYHKTKSNPKPIHITLGVLLLFICCIIYIL
jgi:hypothetical protein